MYRFSFAASVSASSVAGFSAGRIHVLKRRGRVRRIHSGEKKRRKKKREKRLGVIQILKMRLIPTFSAFANDRRGGGKWEKGIRGTIL